MGLIPDETLAMLAGAPKQTQGDEGKVVERDMADIIAGDRYVAAKQVKRPYNGMRISTRIGPSTV